MMDQEQRDSLNRIYDKLEDTDHKLSKKIDSVKDEVGQFKVVCENRFTSVETDFHNHKENADLHQKFRMGIKGTVGMFSIFGVLAALFGVTLCDKF